MSEQEKRNRTPLIILVGLVVAGAVGLGYVTRDKWGAPVPVATAPSQPPAPAPETEVAEQPAAPAQETPATQEAPKAAEQQVAVAKPDTTAEQPAEPAKPQATAEQPAEPAKPDATAKPEVALPSFDTVRVEPGGNAIIAGRAAPGSEIVIKHNGSVIAGGTANADGAFAITPDKPLPEGPGVLSVEMKDKATGKIIASEQTVAVAVKPAAGSTPMVAVLTPDAPTKIVQAPAEAETKLPPMATVNIDAVDYDEKGNMVFAGRGPAGSKVQLYMDNQPLAQGTIGADGTWSIAPKDAIAVGAHALRADEIGADGAVKSRVEIPFFREDAAKVLASRAPPPAQPKTVTENKTVTVQTPDQKTTVTATAPVTVEVKPAEPAAPAAEQAPAAAEAPQAAKPAEPAQQQQTAEAKPAEQAQPAQPATQPEQPVAEAAKPAQPAEQPAQATPPAADTSKQAAVAQPETPAAQPVPDAKIIIQPGNNLWKLSRRIYGKGLMYTVIYEANKEYIRNPDLIYPGQIFITPRAPSAATGQ